MAQTQSVRAINPIGKMRFRNLTVTTEKMRLVGEDFISNKSNKLLNLAGRKVRYSLLKLTSHGTRTNWEKLQATGASVEVNRPRQFSYLLRFSMIS